MEVKQRAILGYPVILDDSLPETEIKLVFGSLDQYIITIGKMSFTLNPDENPEDFLDRFIRFLKI